MLAAIGPVGTWLRDRADVHAASPLVSRAAALLARPWWRWDDGAAKPLGILVKVLVDWDLAGARLSFIAGESPPFAAVGRIREDDLGQQVLD